MTDVIRDVCDYVASARWNDIPAKVQQQAKCCMLDNIGCAILGADDESGLIIGRNLSPLGSGSDATIVRQTERSSVFTAALVNSSYIHATDLSEGIARAVVHPGTVVVPAALAEAELVGASGADAVLAVVLGYEVLIRMGWALGHMPGDPLINGSPQLLTRGWFPPAMLGAFGAVVAAGKLRALNAEQMYQAIGICANLCPTAVGASASQGAMVKPLGCGWASALGVYGAHLAEAGLTGITDIIDVVFSRLVDSVDKSLLVNELGTRYEMQELGMKWVAAGPVRSELECAFEIVGKTAVNISDIEDIHVLTNARTAMLCGSIAPPNLLACKFSAPYCIAQAFSGLPREAFLDEGFTEAAFANPAWRVVAQRIRLSVSDEYTHAFETYPNTSRPCTMTVRMKNGDVHTANVSVAKGNLPNSTPPLEDYRTKFRKVAAPRLSAGRGEFIIEQVGILDTLPGVRGVLEACR